MNLTPAQCASSDTRGNPSEFTECAIPSGANAALIASSETLLRHLICPWVIALLGLQETDGEARDPDAVFNVDGSSAELRASVQLTSLALDDRIERVDLTALRFAIGEDRFDCSATLAGQGRGFDFTVGMAAHASIAVNANGELAISYVFEPVQTDVRLSPWLHVLAAFTGPLLPIVGGIVATLCRRCRYWST